MKDNTSLGLPINRQPWNVPLVQKNLA